MRQALEKSIELAQHDESLDVNYETIDALEQILNSLLNPPIEFSFESERGFQTDVSTDHLQKVVMPGSKGLNIKKNNEEFLVECVFYNPKAGELAYRGKHVLDSAKKFEGVTTIIPINSLKEIPGESKLGLYNPETGELIEQAQ